MATATGRTPAQMFALAFGAVYLLVGIVGFFVTGFDDFASETNEELIIFAINPLHNIVHIALGVVWIGAAASHQAAKSVNLLFGVVLLLVAVLGFAGVLVDEVINVNNADSFLHVATAALAIYFGTAGAEGTARPATT